MRVEISAPGYRVVNMKATDILTSGPSDERDKLRMTLWMYFLWAFGLSDKKTCLTTASGRTGNVFCSLLDHIGPDMNRHTHTHTHTRHSWWPSSSLNHQFQEGMEWGMVNKGGRSSHRGDEERERERVVESPGSSINRQRRWTKKNMAALVRWGHNEEHKDILRPDSAVHVEDWLPSDLCNPPPPHPLPPYRDWWIHKAPMCNLWLSDRSFYCSKSTLSRSHNSVWSP